FVFNSAYLRMKAKGDTAASERLRREYLAYTAAEIDYYAGLNQQVLGYAPPEVMLLHDNLLNSEVLGQVLEMFEKRQYRFVRLREALADAAYRQREEYVTKFGPMWGYRWAADRKVKVNGALEPDVPKWVVDWR